MRSAKSTTSSTAACPHPAAQRRRRAPPPARRARAPRGPAQGACGAAVAPDDLSLFRYSALTFNGHRIHYDRRYVTEIEGYPGLVVHGPLVATLLARVGTRGLSGR